MSKKYINSFIIKNAGNQEQEVRIKIPLEQVEGASDLKNEADATARKLASLKEELEYQEDILTAQGVIFKETITDTYNIREVANGYNIYDGSLAEVKKVEGKTIVSENLIPAYKSSEITGYGLKFTPNSDGSVTVTRVEEGKTAGRVHLTNTFILPAGTYYFNGKAPNINSSYYYIHCNDSSFNHQIITSQGTFTLSKAFTVSLAFYSPGSSQVESYTAYPMLVRGEEAKPFVKSFEGLKSTTFNGIRIVKSKNLLKPAPGRTEIIGGEGWPRGEFTLRPWNGNTIAFKFSASNVIDPPNGAANETISIDNESGIVSFKASWSMGFLMDASVIGGKTYCFSTHYYTDSQNMRMAISWYDKMGRYISHTPKESTYYVTGTAPLNAAWAGCCIQTRSKKSSDESSPTFTLRVGKFQLEEVLNNQATPTDYVPYEEEIYNFPKVELGWGDEIDFEKQQIVSYTKEYIFDGSENWGGDGTSNFHLKGLKMPKMPVDGKSSQWLYKLAYQTGEDCVFVDGGMFYTSSHLTDSFNKNLENWKAYLQSNPLTIRYQISDPIVIPFSPTQIAAGNEYRVFEGGIEQIIGNDAAPWGADLTLAQEYIVKPRGGSDGN